MSGVLEIARVLVAQKPGEEPVFDKSGVARFDSRFKLSRS